MNRQHLPERAPATPAMEQAIDWLIAQPCTDPTEQRAFEAWLLADPEHAAAFEQARAVWHGAPVHQAAVALQARRRPPAWRRHWKPLATAAMLVVGVLNFTHLPLRVQAAHLTQVGERQHLQLEDGSKVLLNTDSAFSSRIDTRQRSARLYEGEAFFEVPPSRRQPLKVQAGPVRADVLDSAFAVSYHDGQAQVRVQRGNVDLSASHDETVRLNAGDSIRIGPRGFGTRERLDPQKDLAWVHGRLIFENCPMGEVLAELRRYYPGWIINTDKKLEQVAVTGNYRLDNPLEVVRSLAQVTSAQVREFPALVILN